MTSDFWNPAALAQLLAGAWLARPETDSAGAFARPITGVSIDSRSTGPGQLFIAIKGDRFDGHDFLEAAASAGAPAVIVSDAAKVPAAWKSRPLPPGALLVPDTLAALQKLAAAYRRSLRALRVVAVTGSNGKTTTTRLIQSVLSTALRGTASIKSFNNHIGVPLTLLAARPGDEFLVSEMGMNHAGEIAPLSDMARPDVALITSVGHAHIENLGSLSAIAQEKACVFRGLAESGLAVAPDDELAPSLAEHLRKLPNLITFGRGPRADLRLTGVEPFTGPGGVAGQRFTINARWHFTIPMAGEHNALNAVAAVAAARRLGLSDAQIAQGLAAAKRPEMRLNDETINAVRVINDAYNASPESMLAALRTFAQLVPPGTAARRVLVLGDMLEMGAESDRVHDEIGRAIAQIAPPDVLVTLGPAASRYPRAAAGAGAKIKHALSLEQAGDAECARVASLLAPGDAVLLKASRRMGLERIVAALKASGEPPAPAPCVTAAPRAARPSTSR